MTATRLRYVAGIDGLRAIAVAAVLLYHAEPGKLPGGFLGVDVFFVISGYLITAVLLAEWRERGRIDLGAFWLRRARRLLPALFFVVAAVLAFAVLFVPEETAGLREDALAAAGYITNWYLVLHQESYFESIGRPSLLRHLWSLAVEEQFYLLWPLLFSGAVRLAGPRAVLCLAIVGAAISAGLMAMLYQPDADPSRVYYGTDTRAGGLFLGAALAMVWFPDARRAASRRQTLVLDALGVAAGAALVASFFRLDQFDPSLYRGGFTAVSVTTAIVIAVAAHPRARLGAVLGVWPLRWLGLRSYGIYLWHWPIFALTRPQLDVPLDGLPLLLLRLALTCALAELSYRAVETPVRSGALSRLWRNLRDARRVHAGRRGAVGAAGGCALAASAVLVAAVASADPPPTPAYISVSAINATAPATATVVPPPGADIGPPPAVAPPTPPAAILPPTPGVNPPPAPASLPPVSPRQAAGPPSAAPSPLPVAAAPGVEITAIGDSVMLGAVPELLRIEGVHVDAAAGRQVSSAIDILRERDATGEIGQVVILHIGNNGMFSERQMEEIMSLLSDEQLVIFLNVSVPREWERPNNTVLADGVKDYPNAVLVDWHDAVAERPDLFWQDGMHLRPEGAQLYASLIAYQLAPR